MGHIYSDMPEPKSLSRSHSLLYEFVAQLILWDNRAMVSISNDES